MRRRYKWMLWFVGVVYVLGGVDGVVFENRGWKGWVVVVLAPLLVLLRIQIHDAWGESQRKKPQRELDLSRLRSVANEGRPDGMQDDKTTRRRENDRET